jgi:N-acetyltransferase 10
MVSFQRDFCRRFASLLSFQFKSFPASLALDIVTLAGTGSGTGSAEDRCRAIIGDITVYDLKRLESYSNNMVDYHLIMDLVPTLARHHFLGLLEPIQEGPEDFSDALSTGVSMSPVQAAILLGMGLQHRSVEEMAAEIKLPVSQILAMFIKGVRKCVRLYRKVHIRLLSSTLGAQKVALEGAAPIDASLAEELGADTLPSPRDDGPGSASPGQVDVGPKPIGVRPRGDKIGAKQREMIDSLDISQFEIPADAVQEAEWEAELGKKGKAVLEGLPTYLNISKSKRSKGPTKKA